MLTQTYREIFKSVKPRRSTYIEKISLYLQFYSKISGISREN